MTLVVLFVGLALVATAFWGMRGKPGVMLVFYSGILITLLGIMALIGEGFQAYAFATARTTIGQRYDVPAEEVQLTNMVCDSSRQSFICPLWKADAEFTKNGTKIIVPNVRIDSSGRVRIEEGGGARDPSPYKPHKIL